MSPHRPYPRQAYNFLSLLGVGMALFGVAAIVIVHILNVFSGHTNSYLGIFIFVVFPGILVLGLILIPIGMWRERRRMARGEERPLVIDLGKRHHRNVLVTFVVGTSIFLLLTTLGLYGGYQYSESTAFCGKVCHTVMIPEYTAYEGSPHARVRCVECHIGPGADWFVRSKISGARQVIKTILNTYERPIPTPVQHLRPAEEVCEECHWPEKFYEANGRVHDYYLGGDEENTHWRINMLIRVGGTSESPRGHASGIHWHIDESNRMVYVASDSSRQSFDMVMWGEGDETVVYTRDGEPLSESDLATARAEGRLRTLDCVDCHNRPTHHYDSPMTAVNEALTRRELDPAIPWIKAEAVRALSNRYWTVEGARDSIAAGLTETYEAELDPDELTRVVERVQALYARNMFPKMGVRWDVYPDNRGHMIFPGCYRCHGSDLMTEEGTGISSDCELCHIILSQGPVTALGDTLAAGGLDYSGLEFVHPVDIGGAEREMPCYDCHSGDDSLY